MRYVWGKYQATAIRPAPKNVTNYKYPTGQIYMNYSNQYALGKNSDGKYYYTSSGSNLNVYANGQGFRSFLVTEYSLITNGSIYSDVMLAASTIGSNISWDITPHGDGTVRCVNTNNHQTVSFYLFEGVAFQQGTFIGDVSSASESTYPSLGALGDYYYQRLGADNIDPLDVTYSKDEAHSGETIVVTVAPSPDKKYSGTVYYQYSYSVNDGVTWINSGSKTTSATQRITIPSGAEFFEVRVQASDNLGFTSTEYVRGPIIEVTSMSVYVGVSGKARQVDKIYIGVNGKAREVIAGYIGVNGKARKFL